MISYLKIFLKKIIPSQKRGNLKKVKRHFISFFKNCNNKKSTLKELEEALRNELGLKKGDRIIVASSFGYLNAGFSPAEAVKLLMDIVTEEGTIMMPYYPPQNSDEWAKEGHIFDMVNTKSGMGVITNVFSKMPNVLKSMHPTKAVCVWGKDAKEIVEGHELAETPFYWDSPYGKFLKMGCKSIGLGLKNIPIFHTFEDVLSDSKDAYYYPETFKLKVITDKQEEKMVETYIHNTEFIAKCVSAGDYVKSLKCKTYKRISFGMSFLYVIDNTDLYNRLKSDCDSGNKKLRLK